MPTRTTPVALRPTRVLLAAVVLLLVGLTTACGDDDETSGTQPDPPTDTGTDGSGGDGVADVSDGEVCGGVTQERLDALVPGLVPQEPTSVALAEETCEWSAPAGEGQWLLQIQVYEGEQFFGADLFDDATELDICDRAFTGEMMGQTIQFLGSGTMVQISLSAIFVPDDEKPGEEGRERLEQFARDVADDVC